MTTDGRADKLNGLLAECQRLYAAIMHRLPGPQDAHLNQLSDEGKRLVVTAIHVLIQDMDTIQGLLKEITLEALPQAVESERIQFYRDKILPKRKGLESLFVEIMDQPNIDLDPRQISHESDAAPVWNILVSGLDYWNQDQSEMFSAQDLAAADRFLFSSFFEPDQWLRNADELFPVLGGDADRKIPGNVRVRLRELYRSFILGNYLAGIALARATLEYALVDRASQLQIDPFSSDPRHPSRTKPLGQLVDLAAGKLPHLKFQMESIVEAGNQTMHPKRRDKLALLPSALRALALSTTEATRTVVENLYLSSR